MKKYLLFFVIFSLVFLVTACSDNVEEEDLDDNNVTTEDLILDEDEVQALEEAAGVNDENVSDQQEQAVMGVMQDGMRVFEVFGRDYKFFVDEKTNPDIIVNEGETVSIIMKSDDQLKHDFVIDEFNVKTNIVSGAAVTSVDFIADKKGTYSYYCSVASHRVKGMEGRLIVR